MGLLRPYAKGVRKERKIVNDARAAGHLAFRSAGSHSPIDVCIIDWKARKIWLIQSKAGRFDDWKARSLENKYKFLNGTYEVGFRVEEDINEEVSEDISGD